MSSVIPTPGHNTASIAAESELDVDVVVVGAGPVGLTAAALLSACGVDVLVVERNGSTSEEPKAISIDDESLRTFAAAGLIDAVLPIVTPGTGTRYYGVDGRPLSRPVPRSRSGWGTRSRTRSRNRTSSVPSTQPPPPIPGCTCGSGPN